MMLKFVCFTLGYSSALSFLINDFSFNTTSSSVHANTIGDLLNLILEEKKIRFQLEDRLNAAESKITRMMEYNAAVSSELEKEKNELEQLRTEYQMFKTQLANMTSKDASLEQQFKNMSTEFNKFSLDARKERENISINMHNMNLMIGDLTQRLSDTSSRTTLNSTAVGFTVYSPIKGTGTSSSLKFYSAAFNPNDIFNMTTGEFVCQQPGLYLFIFTMLRDMGTSNSAYCYIYTNNAVGFMIAYAHDVDTNSYPSGAGSYLVYLQSGDTVYLSNCGNVDHLRLETGFSGCLIQAEN